MIRTVVFDIGNVLADFDYLTYIHKLYTDEEVISHINNAIWGTGCWRIWTAEKIQRRCSGT